ncbi:hypothetical protein [Devosia lacusdianchii]|uniref:hypothetical protein n=1 Tax=Devosia lacusdianchii TaxID=2917991 RepID=UPI001F06841C|nr:hypothetical protein [Devosia sp. JXJ CY 41]
MDAPKDEAGILSSVELSLTPNYFRVGEDSQVVLSRLEEAGFRLDLNYADYPEHYQSELAEGKTLRFIRSGRMDGVCGERLYVFLGFEENRLQLALGQSQRTCL